MQNLDKLIILVLACIAQVMQCVTPEAIVFVKSGHKIVCFPDIHIDFYGRLRAGKWQRSHVEQCAKKHNAYVIVEDMLQYDGGHKKVKDLVKSRVELQVVADKEHEASLRITNGDIAKLVDAATEILRSPNFLNNMVSNCRALGVDAYGAECRHLADMSENYPAEAVAADDVAKEYDEIVAKLSRELAKCKNSAAGPCHDQDAQLFYEIGCKLLAKTEQNAQKYVDNLRGKGVSIAQLIQQDDQYCEQPASMYFSTFTDLRILQAWWNNRMRPLTIICAGAHHIHKISPVFEQLGYKMFVYGHHIPLERLRGDIIRTGLAQEVMGACLDIRAFFDCHFSQISSCVVCAQPFKTTDELAEHEKTCVDKVLTSFFALLENQTAFTKGLVSFLVVQQMLGEERLLDASIAQLDRAYKIAQAKVQAVAKVEKEQKEEQKLDREGGMSASQLRWYNAAQKIKKMLDVKLKRSGFLTKLRLEVQEYGARIRLG